MADTIPPSEDGPNIIGDTVRRRVRKSDSGEHSPSAVEAGNDGERATHATGSDAVGLSPSSRCACGATITGTRCDASGMTAAVCQKVPLLESTTTTARRTLNPDVTYWETESRLGHTFEPPEAPGLYIELALETERPMRDGKPIERKGNRGYPSFVRIDTDSDSGTVLSNTAREIGRTLIALADAADALDNAEFNHA